jgi:hypothetical protein
MKFQNRWYVSPIEAAAQALAPAIQAYCQANTDKQLIGLAALKAAVPAANGAGRDVINHALSILGLEIDDSAAG